MTKNQKILAVIFGLVLVLGVGGYLVSTKDMGTESDQNTDISTTTINIGGVDINVAGPGGVTIEPIESLPPAPNIDRKITYPAAYNAEARTIMDKKIADLRAAIRENPVNFEAWVELGLRYKQVEDYEGARDIWEYVNLFSPGNIVSFVNLGDLYHYHLKDYPKAETNLLQAIKNDPEYALPYIYLHDLYRLSYGVLTTKAADILKQGIAANPDNIDLYMALAFYYKNNNNKIDLANARTYFEKALAKAKVVNNQSLITTITAELNALK